MLVLGETPPGLSFFIIQYTIWRICDKRSDIEASGADSHALSHPARETLVQNPADLESSLQGPRFEIEGRRMRRG